MANAIIRAATALLRARSRDDGYSRSYTTSLDVTQHPVFGIGGLLPGFGVGLAVVRRLTG